MGFCFNRVWRAVEHEALYMWASWAAQFLARGFDVVGTDPGQGAEAKLRKYVDDAWDLLENVGLSDAEVIKGEGMTRDYA